MCTTHKKEIFQVGLYVCRLACYFYSLSTLLLCININYISTAPSYIFYGEITISCIFFTLQYSAMTGYGFGIRNFLIQPILWNPNVPKRREFPFPGTGEFMFKTAYQKLRTILASLVTQTNTSPREQAKHGYITMNYQQTKL